MTIYLKIIQIKEIKILTCNVVYVLFWHTVYKTVHQIKRLTVWHTDILISFLCTISLRKGIILYWRTEYYLLCSTLYLRNVAFLSLQLETLSRCLLHGKHVVQSRRFLWPYLWFLLTQEKSSLIIIKNFSFPSYTFIFYF